MDRRGSTKSVSFLVADGGDQPQTSVSSHSYNFSEYSQDIKMELLKLSTANNLLLIVIYLLLLSASFSVGLQYAMKPKTTEDVQCHIKELDKVKWSFYQKKNLTSPHKGPLNQGCSYYSINYSVLTNLSYEDAIEESRGMIANNPHPIKCSEYLYKNNLSKEFSVVREFNLICEQKSFYSFNFFTQVGGVLGAFPFGIAADIHGRQPAFIVSGLITLIGGCIIPLAPNLLFFVTGKVLVGAGSITLLLSLLVLFTEFCCNKYRSSLMILSFIAWHLGRLVQDNILFTNIKDWRLLELAKECPFLIVVQSILFVPESPRWLMNQKQLNKAWNVLQLMGSTETPPLLPRYPFKMSNCSKQLRIFIKAYFQYRTYITVILNGIGALTYYAVCKIVNGSIGQAYYIFIIIITVAIAEKTFINQTDFALTMTCMQNKIAIMLKCRDYYDICSRQIIFLLLVSCAASCCNKRSLCCNIFLLMATCFIMSILTDVSTVSDINLLLAEILSVTVWIVVTVYALEIFPTSHRATALGLNFSVTQLVSLVYLYYQHQLTYRVRARVLKGFFASFCIISALATMLAPNTYQDIPDTREDLIRDLTVAEQIAFSY